MKCRCNGSSGTDCYWCGTKGNYKRRHLLSKAQPLATKPPVSKPLSERISALQADVEELDNSCVAETILYVHRKLKLLLRELKLYEQQVKLQREITRYRLLIQNLQTSFEQKVKDLQAAAVVS